MFARKLFCAFCMKKSLRHSPDTALFRNLTLSRNSCQQTLVCESLKHRCLLKVFGPDTTEYLQGMVTNDVKYLGDKEKQGTSSSSCMYSMLLNSHGRVLYDTLLYKVDTEEYLLEYDASALPYMQKHLEMFRLRRKVSIKPINDMSVWVIFSSEGDSFANEETPHSLKLISHLRNEDAVVAACKDPRVPQLGCRVILKGDLNLRTLVTDIPLNIARDAQYDLFRYKLGVGEGVKDHPPGNCFPLDCNLDYLNGVSFQKGCYIGQEFTARVNHTGVVRKRLMPIILISSKEVKDYPADCSVTNEKGFKMGKLRSSIQLYGLALLNVEESLKSETLMLKGHDVEVKITKPRWWPQDVDKIVSPK